MSTKKLAIPQLNNLKKKYDINFKLKEDRNKFKLEIKELSSYFDGKNFYPKFPYKLNGSSFQEKVWKALSKIPYGKTTSYGSLAKLINHEKASRAVGLACGKNSLPIIIPCHRVIRQNKSLGGFSAELTIKKKLLDLEKNII